MVGQPGEAPEKDTKTQWTQMFDAMEQLHDLFKSLRVGGFSESQALRIVALVIIGGGSSSEDTTSKPTT